MSRPIRYCGDYQNRNVKFARQMVRDGIPFGSAENAEADAFPTLGALIDAAING